MVTPALRRSAAILGVFLGRTYSVASTRGHRDGYTPPKRDETTMKKRPHSFALARCKNYGR